MLKKKPTHVEFILTHYLQHKKYYKGYKFITSYGLRTSNLSTTLLETITF